MYVPPHAIYSMHAISMTYHTITTSVLVMATSIEAVLPVINREMVM